MVIARGWLGTPFRQLASVRGQGSDCVGVVRGVTIHFVPAAGEASMYVLMFLVLMFRPRGLLGERIERFE